MVIFPLKQNSCVKSEKQRKSCAGPEYWARGLAGRMEIKCASALRAYPKTSGAGQRPCENSAGEARDREISGAISATRASAAWFCGQLKADVMVPLKVSMDVLKDAMRLA
jgi:hypothetical protein